LKRRAKRHHAYARILSLLPLSSTPNLITVILSTINSPSLNYLVSSRSRTLLLVFSLKLLSPVISPHPTLSPLAENHWTHGIGLLLSVTHKVLTNGLPNLHTLISVLRLRSLSVVTLARPPSSSSLKITYRSDNLPLLSLCFTLFLEAPFLFSSTSFWYQFLHFRLTYSSRHCFLSDSPLHIHNSHFHSRLKPTCFTNLTPLVSRLHPGLLAWIIARTVPSELLGFCFSLFFFVSVPCAR